MSLSKVVHKQSAINDDKAMRQYYRWTNASQALKVEYFSILR